jgi:endonuclease/exonuclease/phosphatase family metal-dependent hydrolase
LLCACSSNFLIAGEVIIYYVCDDILNLMPFPIRRRLLQSFTVFTVLVGLLYIMVCLVPFLDSGTFWFVAVLGLGFPVLVVLLLICTIIWFVRNIKVGIGLLLLLSLGWKQIFVMLAMNFGSDEFNAVKTKDSTLRVLSWNVSRLDEHNKEAKGGVSSRSLILDAIHVQDADVLVLQEFFEPGPGQKFDRNIEAFRSMGYAHHYFYPTSVIWEGAVRFGMIIFSRYPIIDSAHFTFGQTPHSEGLMYVDIKTPSKVVRVFSTHMESSRGSKYGYFGEYGSANVVEQGKTVVRGLKRGYLFRNAQADLVREQVSASPHPVILCGDLGDVPNSSAYFTTRGELNDVFLEKGAGFGATFRFISPTLRLDYIFSDPDLKIDQYSRPDFPYSDHYPLVVDLVLGEGETTGE